MWLAGLCAGAVAGACLALRLKVIVLAYDRPAELQRTLSGLAACLFPPQPSALLVAVDCPPAGADTDTAARVQASRAVADRFAWPFGPKNVTVARAHRGILGQWAASWDPPSSDDEVALFVEDDVEVSPGVPLLLARHVLPRVLGDERLFGVALQRAQWVLGQAETGTWRRLDLAWQARARAPWFTYPAVGTWAQAMLPRAWRRFKQDLVGLPGDAVDGLITDHWHAERPGRRLFSPAFTKFALRRRLANVFFSCPNGTVLATSRQPAGVNFGGTTRHYRERLATEAEARQIVLEALRTAAPTRMNHCWDPPESVDSQLDAYGLVFAGTRAARCCLEGQWRVQLPADASEAVGLVPLFSQTTGRLGCWLRGPAPFLAAYLACEHNVRFEDAHGRVLGHLALPGRAGCVTVQVPADVFDPTVRTASACGACTRLQCPFVRGKYPDGFHRPSP